MLVESGFSLLTREQIAAARAATAPTPAPAPAPGCNCPAPEAAPFAWLPWATLAGVLYLLWRGK